MSDRQAGNLKLNAVDGGGSTLQNPDPEFASIQALIHQGEPRGGNELILQTQAMHEAQPFQPGNGAIPFGRGEELIPNGGGVHRGGGVVLVYPTASGSDPVGPNLKKSWRTDGHQRTAPPSRWQGAPRGQSND